MKQILLLLLVLSTSSAVVLQAQDSVAYRSRYMNVRIQTVHGGITDGYLYAVSDTALFLSKEKRRPNLYDTGATIGAIAGYVSGDDPPEHFFALTASEKALGVGIFGGTVGAITGLIVGVAAHRTFVIGGKKERLNHMSQRLAVRMGL